MNTNQLREQIEALPRWEQWHHSLRHVPNSGMWLRRSDVLALLDQAREPLNGGEGTHNGFAGEQHISDGSGLSLGAAAYLRWLAQRWHSTAYDLRRNEEHRPQANIYDMCALDIEKLLVAPESPTPADPYGHKGMGGFWQSGFGPCLCEVCKAERSAPASPAPGGGANLAAHAETAPPRNAP